MTLIPGGYISYQDGNPTAPSFHFYLCDHQGNIRVVTDMNRNIEQVNDYTPFGVLMKNDFTTTSTQRYKYNGKELDRMHGLDLYDYGARLYDSPLGRWHVMDPLCEKYYSVSPYVYCHNIPNKLTDLDGRDDYYDRYGNFLFTNKAKTDNIYIVNDCSFYRTEDGTRMAHYSGKQALCEADLSAEAWSNIATNCLSLMGVDTGRLHNGRVSVTIWTESVGGTKCTDKQYNDASRFGDALSTSRKEDSKALITLYVWFPDTKERQILSTRSNLQSLLGVHEYKGHFQKGYSHKQGVHDLTYELEKHDPIWKKTTQAYRDYINTVIDQNHY